ncbi:MAG: hypothetical protein ACI9BW_004793, partial [Gammaproteobacteria bacterium]
MALVLSCLTSFAFGATNFYEQALDYFANGDLDAA